MIYLLYGIDKYLINLEIKKITNEYQIDKININQYDLDTDIIEDVVEDASMISLFDENKMIICDNALIFTGKKNEIEQNTETLEQYIINPNEKTIIIFIVNSDKLDDRKKITKLIKEKGSVKDLNKVNLVETVKNILEDYKMSYSDINFLIDRCNKNLDIINQEIQKIKLYKDNDKEITHDDIMNLTIQNYDLDIFTLIDDIITKNKGLAILKYREMLKINEEPIKIIIMLANQFRLMYQVKELYAKGHTEKDIIDILEVHPYRIKLALEKSRRYESSVLLSYLERLADLDYDIKSGNTNDELALELFIVNI